MIRQHAACCKLYQNYLEQKQPLISMSHFMVSVMQVKCPSEDKKSHSYTLNEIKALLETYSAGQKQKGSQAKSITKCCQPWEYLSKLGHTEIQNIHANHNFIKTKLKPNKSKMKHFQKEKGKHCSEFRSLKCEQGNKHLYTDLQNRSLAVSPAKDFK